MTHDCITGDCQHDSELTCSIEEYKYWSNEASRGELLDKFVHQLTRDNEQPSAAMKMALKERGLEMRNYAHRAKYEVPNADKNL